MVEGYLINNTGNKEKGTATLAAKKIKGYRYGSVRSNLDKMTNIKSFISKDQWKIIYIKRPMENH